MTQERKHLEALSEFFYSEKSYILDLKLWQNDLRREILNFPFLSGKKKYELCDTVFVNMEKIYLFHRKLFNEMKQKNNQIIRLNSSSPPSFISSTKSKKSRTSVKEPSEGSNTLNLSPDSNANSEESEEESFFESSSDYFQIKKDGSMDTSSLEYASIFLKYFEGFNEYETYCSKLPKSEYEFEKMIRNNKDFAQLIENFMRSRNIENLGAKNFFYRPSSKMARYPLLLKAILKREQNENYKKLYEELIEKLKSITSKIDKVFNNRSHLFKTFLLSNSFTLGDKIQKNFFLGLIFRNVHIIKEGKLIVKKNQLEPASYKQVYIFNKFIVICHTVDDQFGPISIDDEPLYLSRLIVLRRKFGLFGKSEDLSAYYPIFLVRKGDHTIKAFYFEDESTRDIYYYKIKKAKARISKKYKNIFKIQKVQDLTDEQLVCVAKTEKEIDSLDEIKFRSHKSHESTNDGPDTTIEENQLVGNINSLDKNSSKTDSVLSDANNMDYEDFCNNNHVLNSSQKLQENPDSKSTSSSKNFDLNYKVQSSGEQSVLNSNEKSTPKINASFFSIKENSSASDKSKILEKTPSIKESSSNSNKTLSESKNNTNSTSLKSEISQESSSEGTKTSENVSSSEMTFYSYQSEDDESEGSSVSQLSSRSWKDVFSKEEGASQFLEINFLDDNDQRQSVFTGRFNTNVNAENDSQDENESDIVTAIKNLFCKTSLFISDLEFSKPNQYPDESYKNRQKSMIVFSTTKGIYKKFKTANYSRNTAKSEESICKAPESSKLDENSISSSLKNFNQNRSKDNVLNDLNNGSKKSDDQKTNDITKSESTINRQTGQRSEVSKISNTPKAESNNNITSAQRSQTSKTSNIKNIESCETSFSNKSLNGEDGFKIIKLSDMKAKKIIYDPENELLFYQLGHTLYVSKFNCDTNELDSKEIDLKIESFFLGRMNGQTVLALSSKGSYSFSLIYLLKIENLPDSTKIELNRKLYVGFLVSSISFFHGRIIIACKDFEVVDIDTLRTQELLEVYNPCTSALMNTLQNLTAKKIFRISKNTFLLCFDSAGFYIDSEGRFKHTGVVFNWQCVANDFKVTKKYVICLSSIDVSIFELKTGIMIYLAKLKDMRFVEGTDEPLLYDAHSVYRIIDIEGEMIPEATAERNYISTSTEQACSRIKELSENKSLATSSAVQFEADQRSVSHQTVLWNDNIGMIMNIRNLSKKSRNSSVDDKIRVSRKFYDVNFIKNEIKDEFINGFIIQEQNKYKPLKNFGEVYSFDDGFIGIKRTKRKRRNESGLEDELKRIKGQKSEEKSKGIKDQKFRLVEMSRSSKELNKVREKRGLKNALNENSSVSSIISLIRNDKKIVKIKDSDIKEPTREAESVTDNIDSIIDIICNYESNEEEKVLNLGKNKDNS